MIDRQNRTPIMHRYVEYNGTIHFGGIIADDVSASMKEQVEQICRKLDELLAHAGTDKTKLLSAMLYVTDMNRKSEMNEAWAAWIAPEHLPARATIGVADLGSPEVLIEIVVTAAR